MGVVSHLFLGGFSTLHLIPTEYRRIHTKKKKKLDLIHPKCLDPRLDQRLMNPFTKTQSNEYRMTERVIFKVLKGFSR